MEDGDVLMRETMNTAVFSIGFMWLGLMFSPGAGPTSEIVTVGAVATVVTFAGFLLVAYTKREKPKPTNRQEV